MMKRMSGTRWAWIACAALLGAVAPGAAQSIPPRMLSGLVWRNLGPFRGGRVAAVSGAVGEPGVFYAGYPAAGVWKTVNAGITWKPMFDSVKDVSSVGAVAVAPSDPNVVYAGTGDMITGGAINEGNGIYKSTDAGKTWRHIGLDSTKQIPSIVVDPNNPDIVLVAAQGNVHEKGQHRGVFRSTDGGKTWTRTLFVNDSSGIEKLARAYDVPNVVFATSDSHFTRPGGPAFYRRRQTKGPTDTKLYKSTDGGVTWHEITGGGLPHLFGRTSVAVAMHTNAQRVFLITNTGLYRSDDGGTTWRQMDPKDTRIRNGQGGYNCGVYVNSQNPDIVYTINTAGYESRDGGKTFTGFIGAPGGDDPQQMWIDPTNGKRLFVGLDQGASVSLDGGNTWSPWYNQSTEQVYHIATDNSWPYWVYAPQQDAGAIRTRSRGNYGEIGPLDWSPVGGWEWGTVMPDPLNPNVVYASGSGILKISYPSEQVVNVSPAVDPNSDLRSTSTNPLVFAPWNPHELFAGFQYLMATTDGGMHWTKMSPNLGYPKGVKPLPESGGRRGRRSGPRQGYIEAISPSTVQRGVIWVSTNNGLIKLTRDNGQTWQDVSIPNLPDSDLSDIPAIDASHQNPAEAYAAVDTHRAGDYHPYLYRTTDYGKTWKLIVNGLPTGQPSGSFTRVIRADTKKQGLLFAGTESGMYVSFNDGDNWQSLQLNLPNTSYRDALIKGNDLVVGTFGRGIWVLDDISPLRQMTAEVAHDQAHLFRPGEAVRVRRNVNQDTPFHKEVPHALNPPPGALIYYSLDSKPSGTVTLDILDPAGHEVRHMSSAPVKPVALAAHPPEPNYWLKTLKPLPTAVGLNRVDWNIRYDDPPAFHHTFDINANPHDTPPSPQGPLALPGEYTVKLTVDGKSYTQTVEVRNDPRSPASEADLVEQHALEMKTYRGIREAWNGHRQAEALGKSVDEAVGAHPSGAVAKAVKKFESALDSVGGKVGAGRRPFFRGVSGPPGPASFVEMNGTLIRHLEELESGDTRPTPGMHAAWANACSKLAETVGNWHRVNGKDLDALNAVLTKHGVRAVQPSRPALEAPTCPAGN